MEDCKSNLGLSFSPKRYKGAESHASRSKSNSIPLPTGFVSLKFQKVDLYFDHGRLFHILCFAVLVHVYLRKAMVG